MKITSGGRHEYGDLDGGVASEFRSDAPSERDTVRSLTSVLRGHAVDDFERRLVQALQDPLFDQSHDASTAESCRLAYARMRFLRSTLDLRASDLLENPQHMLALHAWSSVVDGTLTTLLTIHYNLCIGSIVQHGEGRAELAPLLDELDRMESVGVFLATELAYGNNVQALRTEAHFDRERDEFVIHTPCREAQKFMPNTGAGDVPKLAVVMARLKVEGADCGVYPFIVRIRTSEGPCEGVRVTALGGKPDYALDNAVTSFDNVRVPRSHWLHGAASRIDADGRFHSSVRSRRMRFLAAMDRVQTGKLCLSAAGAAVTAAALQMTLNYAAQRRTFSPAGGEVPVLSYRTYQRTVTEAVATNYASSLMVQHAQQVRASERDNTVVNRTLALCKVFVSSRSLEVLSQCREKVGAQGMFSANRIISYWAQVNGIVTAEGDNEVLTIKSARELLLGMSYTLPEAIGERGSIALLQSTDYLASLLAARERSLALRLRAMLGGATDDATLFAAWNDHLVEACELAHVHAARMALARFDHVLDEIEDEHARAIVERLMRSFALKEIARHAGPLVADGSMPAELAGALETERAAIARALAPNLTLIERAYALPTSILRAPIAGDYLAAYDFMPRQVVHDSYIRPLVASRPGLGAIDAQSA